METSKKDLKINVNGFLVGAENYDDMGAHNLLESLMLEQKELWVRFSTDYWDYMCAKISTKGMKQFNYRLSQENFEKLMGYLVDGSIESFQFNFEELEIHKGDDSCDLEVLKSFTKDNYEKLKFTPLFETANDLIKASIWHKFGGIFFEVPRTPELIDFIRENGYSL
ncbi:hypothetical protein M2101_002316 [Parabacteroides sp. PM5-20]|uniref:hypothetical protein n=1 Tax=unclassified Parabacteroides TaxID=2649774 RepID=UPI0013D1BD0D|nr:MULTISPECIES: hypothetical protein [unclassified Parabacteroides]MDH6535630.1 hypothetical protein [Parabacteroides sp. PM5-20]